MRVLLLFMAITSAACGSDNSKAKDEAPQPVAPCSTTSFLGIWKAQPDVISFKDDCTGLQISSGSFTFTNSPDAIGGVAITGTGATTSHLCNFALTMTGTRLSLSCPAGTGEYEKDTAP